jgi:glycosyltransferase involved in cell wall biosynthesis
MSQLNAQNARNFQLFEASKNIRVVYLKGLKIKYTDMIILRIFNILIKLLKYKIAKYRVVHIFSIPRFKLNQKQVLHLDDPTYSLLELQEITKWQNNLIDKNGEPILICTNEYTKNWFETRLEHTKIYVIEQGFKYNESDETQASSNFSCAYSSPYIHFGKDKHANHSTWGAETLIKEIIPLLHKRDPDIEIHLVGELGEQAFLQLSKFENIVTHGRVSFEKNTEILSKCKIAIYPRKFDHKRSILKIFSYIGAGLPVVTFNLVDTQVVRDFELGIAVNNVDDFIDAIIELKASPENLEKYKNNIIQFRPPYSWENLAKKMNDLF